MLTKSSRSFWTVGILSLLVCTAVCRLLPTLQVHASAEEYPSHVAKVLIASGTNRQELEKFLNTYPRGDERRGAGEFIVGNLPLFDAGTVKASQLEENLDYAFLAKEIMPWGNRVPSDLFLYFVLPHRISQEPPEGWRRPFLEELAPLLIQHTSMGQAALEINEWCYRQVHYRPTTKRDLGPLSLRKRGWGRCEEQNILFIAAARSVCIPARQCYTPYWQHADGNHAWVEIWADGKWHFLDTGAPQATLDHPWFRPFVHKLALTIASFYGSEWPHSENVYRSGPGFTLLNTTAFYTPTTSLHVRVLGLSGRPFRNAEVFVSVFNGGSLRPIASMKCDGEGRGHLEMGFGSYLLSVASGSTFDFRAVHLLPGAPPTVTMDLGNPTLLSEEYHLGPFPQPVSSLPTPHDPPTRAQQEQKESARLSTFHQDALQSHEIAISHFFSSKKMKNEREEVELKKALRASGSNCLAFLRLLNAVPRELRPTLEKALILMDSKDLVECMPDALPDQIRLAEKARLKVLETGLDYDEDCFLRYVLHNRVYLEPWSDWRKDLSQRFSYLRGQNVADAVSKVNDFVNGLETTEKEALSPLLTPGCILRTGRITTETERAIAAVAILRALGIPARYSPHWGHVEFYCEGNWIPMSEERAGSNGIETPKTENAMPQSNLRIIFVFPDAKHPPEKLSYLKDFSLCRLQPRGTFEVLNHLPVPLEKPPSTWRFDPIPPGKYFLIMGKRLKAGDTLVRIKAVSCEAGRSHLLRVSTKWL